VRSRGRRLLFRLDFGLWMGGTRLGFFLELVEYVVVVIEKLFSNGFCIEGVFNLT